MDDVLPRLGVAFLQLWSVCPSMICLSSTPPNGQKQHEMPRVDVKRSVRRGCWWPTSPHKPLCFLSYLQIRKNHACLCWLTFGSQAMWSQLPIQILCWSILLEYQSEDSYRLDKHGKRHGSCLSHWLLVSHGTCTTWIWLMSFSCKAMEHATQSIVWLMFFSM